MAETQNIYLSSGAITAQNIDELIERCLVAGVHRIELASGLACDIVGLECLEAAKEAHDFSYLIHNYFPAPRDPFVLNLASLDPDTLARSKAHCLNAIDWCCRLGSPFFSVHSGFALPVEAGDLGNPAAWRARAEGMVIDLDASREVFAATVREIADYAAAHGVRLLLENNVVSPELTCDSLVCHGLLLSEGHEVAEFLHNLDHHNVGLLVDVGHTKVSGTALGFELEIFMDAVAEYIDAFHLSDNDGQADTNQMFEADAWFAPYLHAIPDATYVIEVYRLSEEQIRRQHAVLEDMLVRRATMC